MLKNAKSRHSRDKNLNWCRKLAQARLTSHQGSGLKNADVMFVILPRGDKVARRVECNFGNNNENEEVVIAHNNTNTTAAEVGVNNTCATTTTTTTAPGGHGGPITLFRNRR